MHRRKKYVVYPPNYKPGDGFVIRKSKFQAWKTAVRSFDRFTRKDVRVC